MSLAHLPLDRVKIEFGVIEQDKLGRLEPGQLRMLRLSIPDALDASLESTVWQHPVVVSGHVDGLGTVLDQTEDARSIRLRIEVPKELTKYIAQKGSICIDGISLTVNSIDGCIMGLNIVPHTQQRTVIQHYRNGHQVNIEVDVIARYLERLLLNQGDNDKGGVSPALLVESGFIK